MWLYVVGSWEVGPSFGLTCSDCLQVWRVKTSVFWIGTISVEDGLAEVQLGNAYSMAKHDWPPKLDDWNTQQSPGQSGSDGISVFKKCVGGWILINFAWVNSLFFITEAHRKYPIIPKHERFATSSTSTSCRRQLGREKVNALMCCSVADPRFKFGNKPDRDWCEVRSFECRPRRVHHHRFDCWIWGQGRQGSRKWSRHLFGDKSCWAFAALTWRGLHTGASHQRADRCLFFLGGMLGLIPRIPKFPDDQPK